MLAMLSACTGVPRFESPVEGPRAFIRFEAEPSVFYAVRVAIREDACQVAREQTIARLRSNTWNVSIGMPMESPLPEETRYVETAVPAETKTVIHFSSKRVSMDDTTQTCRYDVEFLPETDQNYVFRDSSDEQLCNVYAATLNDEGQHAAFDWNSATMTFESECGKVIMPRWARPRRSQ